MRIAYITQSYPPMISGASLVVKSLAHGMAARGHSVLVIAASDQGRAYTTQKGRVKIARLTSVPNPKRAQQKVVLWSRKMIEDELKYFSADILHVHDILTMGVFGVQTAQTLNTPIITTVHQLPWFVTAYLPKLPGLHETVEYSLWEYSRWLNKQCQTMVVPTSTIAETIRSKVGFRPNVISNGIDLQRFNTLEMSRKQRASLCEKYGLNPGLPIILHVGRLDTDKRVEVVIQAAAKTMRKTSAQLLVIGNGEHREELMHLAQHLGIGDRSHFPGFVSQSGDLPELYRLASIFTTASEIETQGLVLLEALASGLPVVAVNATCISELVIHGQNGLLAAPRDTDGMANALTAIIRKPSFANQMGRVGRAIAQEHSIAASLNKHEKLYRKLVYQCHASAPTQISKLLSFHEKTQGFLRQLSNIFLGEKEF
ncbi:MAG: glycosyltransferase [Anaerolineae bacterium]|jgi:glycosyltransferase involved in cell wall biosynthesis|nr:glycosyltransferase [Anaerolineae bacterium]